MTLLHQRCVESRNEEISIFGPDAVEKWCMKIENKKQVIQTWEHIWEIWSSCAIWWCGWGRKAPTPPLPACGNRDIGSWGHKNGRTLFCPWPRTPLRILVPVYFLGNTVVLALMVYLWVNWPWEHENRKTGLSLCSLLHCVNQLDQCQRAHPGGEDRTSWPCNYPGPESGWWVGPAQ